MWTSLNKIPGRNERDIIKSYVCEIIDEILLESCGQAAAL